MDKALYLVGALAIVCGGFLAAPTVREGVSAGDPFLILGAPIVMNGITLGLYGVLIFFLGRMLALMGKIAQKTIWLDAWADEGKVIIKCAACLQQLRVPAGKTGTVNCPKCGSNFVVKT